jgi:hypothetical protein
VLAERHSAGHIGRTALMKYMYFLQTLRGVPLGYNFSLYSYGPFDSDVLSDLSSAEATNIVTSAPVFFSGGYGYQIQPGTNANRMKQECSSFLADHKRDIDWLFSEFGNLNSAELELTSTIVYVDKEFSQDSQNHQALEIADRVTEIKPHFSKPQVQRSIDLLRQKGVLTSIDRSSV